MSENASTRPGIGVIVPTFAVGPCGTTRYECEHPDGYIFHPILQIIGCGGNGWILNDAQQPKMIPCPYCARGRNT